MLENVFKHNALYKDKKLTISIKSHKNGIQIKNNIVKRIDSKVQSFGIGLKNIKKQYEYVSKKSKPIFESTDDYYQVWVPFIDDSKLV